MSEYKELTTIKPIGIAPQLRGFFVPRFDGVPKIRSDYQLRQSRMLNIA